MHTRTAPLFGGCVRPFEQHMQVCNKLQPARLVRLCAPAPLGCCARQLPRVRGASPGSPSGAGATRRAALWPPPLLQQTRGGPAPAAR